MTITFLFGFLGVVFALAALIIIGDVLQRKRRDKVRVIVNARPPMLYDEHHIDRPTYERSGEAMYSVWCGGSEVNDYYLTKEQAENLAFEYEIDGYENVTITKEKEE